MAKKQKTVRKSSNGSNSSRRSARRKGGARVSIRSTGIAASSKTTIRRQPQQRTLPNGDVIITHRELLGPATTAGASFARDLFVQINAGSPTLAPWLSNLSQQYESYLFTSLSFDYVPHVPTTYGGQVWLSVDYDPGDAPPASEQQFAVTPSSISGPVHQPLRMVCRQADLCKRAPNYFVRTPGSGTANTAGTIPSLRSYDTGNFFTAFSSVTSPAGAFTGKVGYIWVSYTVKLFTPQYAAPPLAAFVSADGKFNVTSGSNYVQKLSQTAADACTLYDANIMTAHPKGIAPTSVTDVPQALAILRTAIVSPGTAVPVSNLTQVLNVAGAFVNPIHNDVAAGTNAFGSFAQLVSMFLTPLVAGQAIDTSSVFTSAVTDPALQIATDFDILSIPQLGTHSLASIFTNAFGFTTKSVRLASSGALTAANPFGTALTRPHLSVATYDTTTGVLTLHQGQYLVVFGVTGTVITGHTPAFAGTGASANVQFSVINAAATSAASICDFFVASTGTIDFSQTATTVTSARCWIVPYQTFYDDSTNHTVLGI